MIGKASFLVLDLGLDAVGGVRGICVQGVRLASVCLGKDLHGEDLLELGEFAGSAYQKLCLRQLTSIAIILIMVMLVLVMVLVMVLVI